jgi:predicted hotdog family 3-hydroxylacyl-ACP dehydratase
MSMPDIGSLVPHTGSMVIIDRIISADEESLCAEVGIREDSLFYQDGGVGAWVGIEYMAQAIAAHAGYLANLLGEPVKIGFLLGSRRYECCRPSFMLGDVLRIDVKRLLVSDNGIGSYDCSIHNMNKKLANATVTVFQPANETSAIGGNTE